MTMLENDNCAKIVEVLNKIDIKRLKRLAKHDVAIKATLELVDACNPRLAATQTKTTSGLNLTRARAQKTT